MPADRTWWHLLRPWSGRDHGGQAVTLTDADLAAIAASVTDRLPIVLGHAVQPETPAAGWIDAAEIRPDGLWVRVHSLTDAVARGIRQRQWVTLSARLTGGAPWTLDHVALLGAHPPAVTGLTPITLARRLLGRGRAAPEPAAPYLLTDRGGCMGYGAGADLAADLTAERSRGDQLDSQLAAVRLNGLVVHLATTAPKITRRIGKRRLTGMLQAVALADRRGALPRGLWATAGDPDGDPDGDDPATWLADLIARYEAAEPASASKRRPGQPDVLLARARAIAADTGDDLATCLMAAMVEP